MEFSIVQTPPPAPSSSASFQSPSPSLNFPTIAMGNKKGKTPKKSYGGYPKRKARNEYVAPEDDDMDDEIDAFIKQRDKVPLDIDQDEGDSDEDNEQPVFELEHTSDDEEDSDDEDEDDTQRTRLEQKITGQQKYLRGKLGGVEDDMHIAADDEDEEEKQSLWGKGKNAYYNGDNVDYEIQSSDEDLMEEETEVLRLLRERKKDFSNEDYGLKDVTQADSNHEQTIEEMLEKGKSETKSSFKNGIKDDKDAPYNEIIKDLNSLSREEQMSVVESAAPELVGLLSELNDALEKLENKINPLLVKVKERKDKVKEGMHYLEVKQALLLAYCQSITFYLLLKSEGQTVRDHPVIARLVEIKSLLDKMEQLDEHLELEFEEILAENPGETEENLIRKVDNKSFESSTKIQGSSLLSQETRGTTTMQNGSRELVKTDSLKNHANGQQKRKRQDDQVSAQSLEMLKVRAALEEKLKQKGISSSNPLKPHKAQKHRPLTVNGQFETVDDFDDDITNTTGQADSLRNKVSEAVTMSKAKKPKIVSGDDDLPPRDDIGERRRKHELQVLAGAGINSEDEIGEFEDNGDAVMDGDSDSTDSKNDVIEQAEKRRDAKRAAKAKLQSRSSETPYLIETETLVDGKRQISTQIQKNRGMTPKRNKDKKNPRTNYKNKHKQAVKRRKGQVRDVRTPSLQYGGEQHGINAIISKSIRFKN